jgi:hypothetical protein
LRINAARGQRGVMAMANKFIRKATERHSIQNFRPEPDVGILGLQHCHFFRIETGITNGPAWPWEDEGSSWYRGCKVSFQMDL